VASLQKMFSRIMHPLVSTDILSMHRYNISITIFIKSIHIKKKSSINALVVKLGHNLSNILLTLCKFPEVVILEEIYKR
jgi:hypothetical protein